MRTSTCRCGNRLFFENYGCLACGSVVGLCQSCFRTNSFTDLGNGQWQCDQADCQAVSVACEHREQSICNGMHGGEGGMCPLCQSTILRPDTSDDRGLKRWRKLERAKRRLLLALRTLGLPPYASQADVNRPLTFEFKAADRVANPNAAPVITGHLDGLITIDAEEADSDRREAHRVALGEPQRTLIGHLRHEVGHYIDWTLAYPNHRDQYIQLFGDPMAVDYEAAKQRYYAEGPTPQWDLQHVSAYASMHPWEDFAETMNAYLDILAIAETAIDQGLSQMPLTPDAPLTGLVDEALRIAIVISEFNGDLGMRALLPEKLPLPVMQKLEFIHGLRV